MLAVLCVVAPVEGTVIWFVLRIRAQTSPTNIGKVFQAYAPALLPGMVSGFEKWSETEEGSKVIDGIVSEIVEEGWGRIQRWLASQSGAAQRASMPPMAKILGGIRTGNPLMDGLWGYLGPQFLPHILKRLPTLGEAAAEGGEAAAGAAQW